jgi:hypothetical protein
MFLKPSQSDFSASIFSTVPHLVFLDGQHQHWPSAPDRVNLTSENQTKGFGWNTA